MKSTDGLKRLRSMTITDWLYYFFAWRGSYN